MNHKDFFSEQSVGVMRRAFGFASQLGNSFAGSEQILWSLAEEQDSAAAKVLHSMGLDAGLLRELIEKYAGGSEKSDESITVNLTKEGERVLELAEAEAKKLHHKQVEPEHLLLGILQEPGTAAYKLLVSTGTKPDELVAALLKKMGKEWPREAVEKEGKNKKETKTLDEFSTDLTALAREGKLDPVIGRSVEIGRVIQILSRRTKNNPVLIGEPGVGKTAVAEGLAQRIVAENVPETLVDYRVLSMDLGKMISGTKYRGDFEERITNYLDEAKAADDVILFIDELHTLIGAGSAEGSMDAANVFKPALSRGEIQVIGATTLNEYRKHIEKDTALERRFQPVQVNEPSREDAVEILFGLRERYEQHHNLKITDEAVEAAVELSTRYIQDRYLPDKAIDLIDEAGSRVRTNLLTTPPHLKELEENIQKLNSQKLEAVQNQDFEKAAKLRDEQGELRRVLKMHQDAWAEKQADVVTPEDIASVVSVWTGIPVTMLTEAESERLMKLEETLHERVVGQDEAVKAVSKAIRRSRVGIKEPGHPIGSFLFLGPTGVGKTEVCRTLAKAMFQDEDAIIRMDMSEFMERHTVSKLIGSPPGYVGYDEGGQLTEKVRRKPYSIVLFDEVEKAHPDVWNALLQIMDDGRLTDAQGRTVDFKNTIIVMTSNIGARDILGKSSLGFAKFTQSTDTRPVEELREKIMGELKRTFQPEFLNRLDDIIVFHQLEKAHIRAIAGKMLQQLQQRSAQLGIQISIEDSAADLLAERGFDPLYGARPLRRTIQSSLEDAIAEKILEGSYTEGDRMIVTGVDGELKVELSKDRPTEELVSA